MSEGEGGSGSGGRGWVLPRTEVIIPETYTKKYLFGLFRKELRVTSADVRKTCNEFTVGIYKNALDLYLEDGTHVVTDARVIRRLPEDRPLTGMHSQY